MTDRERFIDAVLAALAEQLEDAEPRDVTFREEHSNDLAEVRFADGRTLMVKRAAVGGSAERFRTSRLGSELLRKRAGVIAPRHLDLPIRLDGRAIEAYWRIPYPTLERLWHELDRSARDEALRDLGRLLARIHSVDLTGHGPLPDACERGGYDLGEFLARDLERRLRPSVEGSWPVGLEAVDRLIERIPALVGRLDDGPAVLVHNDLWTGNVLCDTKDPLHCVGVLDLEDAFAGPPEADLAKTRVLHGPLFGHELTGAWFDRVLEGHGGDADGGAISYFRVYHLLNMGFHAAVVGYEEHARSVVRAVEDAIDAFDAWLDGGRRAGAGGDGV